MESSKSNLDDQAPNGSRQKPNRQKTEQSCSYHIYVSFWIHWDAQSFEYNIFFIQAKYIDLEHMYATMCNMIKIEMALAKEKSIVSHF